MTSLEVVCREHPTPTATRPVGHSGGHSDGRSVTVLDDCLAVAPRRVVVEPLAAGTATVIVRTSGCERGSELAERFSDLVAVLGDRLRLCVEEEPDPAAARVDRRALLGLPGGSESSDVHVEVHRAAVLDDEEGPDQRRLVTAVAAVLGAREVDDTLLATPAPGLRLHARRGHRKTGCTACRVCVLACPEQALSLAVDADLATLTQLPMNCSGCEECVQACPEDVLAVAHGLSWAEQLDDTSVPLATVHTSVCGRCGARFPSWQGEYCEVCTFRRDNPFGMHLPPQVEELLRRRTHGSS